MQTITKNTKHIEALAAWLAEQPHESEIDVLPCGAWVARTADAEGGLDYLIAFRLHSVTGDDYDEFAGVLASITEPSELGEWIAEPFGYKDYTPDGCFYRFRFVRN